MSDKTHTPRYVKLLLIAGVSLLLLIEAWCGFRVHELSEEQKHYKVDYAFVNNVSYGLLSVDAWREQGKAVSALVVGDGGLRATNQLRA